MRMTRLCSSDSCMFHVQIPLVLGILCGTLIYVSIFGKDQIDPVKIRPVHALRTVESKKEEKTKVGRPESKIFQPSVKNHFQLLARSKGATSNVGPDHAECKRMNIKFKKEFPDNVEFPQADDCQRWYNMAGTVRKCVTEYMTINGHGDGWRTLNSAWHCCGRGMYRLLSVTPLTNGRDTKYIVFPGSVTLPCSAVWIGLANGVDIAKRIRRVIPQCEQYAVETNKTLGQSFEDIGDVHYVALSARPSVDNPSRVTFTTLLQTRMKLSEVDYLFVTGPAPVEQYLLRWLLMQKKKKRDRIALCFITMDLHGPLDRPTFHHFINRFLKQSDYLLMHATEINATNQRIFLLNDREPFCVEKYFGQWCQPAEVVV